MSPLPTVPASATPAAMSTTTRSQEGHPSNASVGVPPTPDQLVKLAIAANNHASDQSAYDVTVQAVRKARIDQILAGARSPESFERPVRTVCFSRTDAEGFITDEWCDQ